MTTETVEEFRARARAWIRANLEPLPPGSTLTRLHVSLDDEEELAGVARDRAVQRSLFDARLAGICFPEEYGGLGLTMAHQRAFNEEIAGYEYPVRAQVPTMTPCAAVLLEFGTEEQKREHIPAILRGEELWMQFLSEPGGGSDVAGATTTATREGDGWVLNGSKIWTTGAWWSDWGLCLARTNWDVPKHRGLTVFILPIHQPGVDVHRIEMLDGSKEFCQEFITDVRVPDSDRIGEVDGGWTVATRWLHHERLLYNSPYVTVPVGEARGGGIDVQSLAEFAHGAHRYDDPSARPLIGEAHELELVRGHLQRRIAHGMTTGAMSGQAAAISRLFTGTAAMRVTTLLFDLAGPMGGAWGDDEGLIEHAGPGFLLRQRAAIGGGTTEMARNVISERVLGMPRERALDRDVPFRDVPRGPSSRT
jgi:alkylation response protein AidB-like acyl-CoA dehydrogenase